ncbi:MAG TPA: DoxX family membrane protein [Dermatophilaceae bacterium]|nr:DoxX family membrane protein [Dermatophilaceae bacterium]HMT91119.1 DoxX family membrane protein [Dermatophilaceae bacterium]
MTRERRLDLLGTLLRLVLGGVLLVAGALKVTNLGASALAVRAYQLLPYDLAGYVGYALPVVEIIVGLLLILGLFTRAAAVLGGLLMLAFVIGICWAWAKGLSIDCGCFGGGGEISSGRTAYPLDFARDLVLLLAAGWLVRRPATAYALDARL